MNFINKQKLYILFIAMFITPHHMMSTYESYKYNEHNYQSNNYHKLIDQLCHPATVTWLAISTVLTIDTYAWHAKNNHLKNIPTGEQFDTIPTPEQRFHFFQEKLAHKDHEINFYKLTFQTNKWSYGKLTKLIEEIDRIAGSSTITMKLINVAYNNIQLGLRYNESLAWCFQNFLFNGYQRSVAIHEAGHAIIFIYFPCGSIINEATIESRHEFGGFVSNLWQNQYKELTIEEVENQIVMALSGRIAQQVCGKLPNYSQQMLMYNDAILNFFSPIFSPTDMKIARHFATLLALYYDDTLNEQQLNYKIDEIIIKTYKIAYKFLENHQDEIEKIADLLMQQSTVEGDDIYQLLGFQRPLYDFETW